MFTNYDSAARALALWCQRRGIRPDFGGGVPRSPTNDGMEHRLSQQTHHGPADPRAFVDLVRELRKGPMARPMDAMGRVERHDEQTEALISYADSLAQVLAEHDAQAAGAAK
jgi:hypothetical protein